MIYMYIYVYTYLYIYIYIYIHATTTCIEENVYHSADKKNAYLNVPTSINCIVND